MKTLKDIPHLEGVRVLLRADFNLPLVNGTVRDDFRIKAALPTIHYLWEKGAKIIMISHIEASDGSNLSLEPVAEYLNKMNERVIFVKDYKRVHELVEEGKNGEVFLLENLRYFDGEKNNDPKFAKELASLADIYVNDGFSVSHREHASIVGVPKYLPSYAGIQLEKEVTNLSRALKPEHPFIFILGGAKFETKLPLLDKFVSIADMIFVGGALANDLFKAKGYEVGTSRVSDKAIDLSKFVSDPKILLPLDIETETDEIKPANKLLPTDKIMDSGPQSVELLREKINTSKFILWNGPLGMYEGGFKEPTQELAKIISEATTNGATSIVGGGDTLAAINELGNHDTFTFISTGGGAMLDFLAKGTLVGIEALEESANT